jgi:hypothetical protein
VSAVGVSSLARDPSKRWLPAFLGSFWAPVPSNQRRGVFVPRRRVNSVSDVAATTAESSRARIDPAESTPTARRQLALPSASYPGGAFNRRRDSKGDDMTLPIGETLIQLNRLSTVEEVEAAGRALVDELAFWIAGVDDADLILATCYRIQHCARGVFDRVCPEMDAEQRAAAAMRFTDQVQICAVALQARYASVVSLAIH